MKRQRRLTRQESREATRARLVEAAEKVFVRSGFDASSVERIAGEAGFSRGAFYSNFRNKDELFMEVLSLKRLEVRGALAEIFRREANAAKRLSAVRDWFVSQQWQKPWIVLETEFTLRAVRNRAVKARLASLRGEELESYAALVSQHFEEAGIPMAGHARTIALSLTAIVQGLGFMSLVDTSPDAPERFAAARDLVFNRLSGMERAATAAR